ncbi:3D domain-containing protein [Oceanobacillus picturae]|jgi:3D (Asp-Asp-Asp) domain-containing protein/LysM repeat protein|uniref:3D domain-containing protein n=1 Tax=Oceanobacillus picturae TaxID=171693 RepID=UPI000E6A50F5|nr:3D domain-containing protein [Oceanobacillus picturae]RIU92783.1 LysM peptidoglycan-binding domain-containing protein [Oceanobacillus picturae]
MRKLVASFATGIIIAGAAATTVSAEEYEVKPGDNLWDIADEYNTTVDDLVDINELKSTVILPKQTLFINEMYEVEKGDTLIGISQKFDTTVEDLKDWNELDSDLLTIGQELKIQGVNVAEENKPATKVEKKETEEKEVTTQNTAKADKKEQEAKAEKTTKQTSDSDQKAEGKTISVTATAYTANCDGCSGVTSTGVDLNKNPDAKVIAVDPNVIPLGSKVYVEGYGYATAADIGGAIKGNKIDLHVPNKDAAYDWGVRTVDVTVVE